MDNEFDVAGLMEEAETRQAALDQVAELEEELARVAERLAETEMEAMSQQVGWEMATGAKCYDRCGLKDDKGDAQREFLPQDFPRTNQSTMVHFNTQNGFLCLNYIYIKKLYRYRFNQMQSCNEDFVL